MWPPPTWGEPPWCGSPPSFFWATAGIEQINSTPRRAARFFMTTFPAETRGDGTLYKILRALGPGQTLSAKCVPGRRRVIPHPCTTSPPARLLNPSIIEMDVAEPPTVTSRRDDRSQRVISRWWRRPVHTVGTPAVTVTRSLFGNGRRSPSPMRSEEHTSELQSLRHLV